MDSFIFVSSKCESSSIELDLNLISQGTTWSVQNIERLQDALGICESTWYAKVANHSC